MNTQINKKFLIDIKQLEKTIIDAPYLQNIIEELLETHLNTPNITKERFNILWNSVHTLDDEMPLFRCISFARKQKRLVYRLVANGIDENFATWFWSISLKYGELFQNCLAKINHGLDWKGISYRVVAGPISNDNIEITIERFDGNEFIMESSLFSIIRLVSDLTEAISDYYEDDTIPSKEKELLLSINTELNNLLTTNDPSISQHSKN
ncbi:hypothetical protein ACVCK3_20800 [Bacillus cereus]|nr:hypothetical protein [Bacillus cereus]